MADQKKYRFIADSRLTYEEDQAETSESVARLLIVNGAPTFEWADSQGKIPQQRVVGGGERQIGHADAFQTPRLDFNPRSAASTLPFSARAAPV